MPAQEWIFKLLMQTSVAVSRRNGRLGTMWCHNVCIYACKPETRGILYPLRSKLHIMLMQSAILWAHLKIIHIIYWNSYHQVRRRRKIRAGTRVRKEGVKVFCITVLIEIIPQCCFSFRVKIFGICGCRFYLDSTKGFKKDHTTILDPNFPPLPLQGHTSSNSC